MAENPATKAGHCDSTPPLPAPPLRPAADVAYLAITERTAVAALPALHWMDGAVIDLVRVARRLREVNRC